MKLFYWEICHSYNHKHLVSLRVLIETTIVLLWIVFKFYLEMLSWILLIMLRRHQYPTKNHCFKRQDVARKFIRKLDARYPSEIDRLLMFMTYEVSIVAVFVAKQMVSWWAMRFRNELTLSSSLNMKVWLYCITLDERGLFGNIDNSLRPVTRYWIGENIYAQIPNSISANSFGWEYDCFCYNLRWAKAMMSRVFLNMGCVKIPFAVIESFSHSSPRFSVSLRSMALRSATSKQLTIVNISCEICRL